MAKLSNFAIQNPSFAVDTEQLADVFTPVRFKHLVTGDVVTADDAAEFNLYSKNAKYEQVKEANGGRSTSRGQRAATKRKTTFAEGRAIGDKNLAESLGMPSLLQEKGVGYTFTAKAEACIIQVSRRTNGEFPSTQVSATIDGQNLLFCILLDGKDEQGVPISLVINENDQTRSGMSVDRA